MWRLVVTQQNQSGAECSALSPRSWTESGLIHSSASFLTPPPPAIRGLRAQDPSTLAPPPSSYPHVTGYGARRLHWCPGPLPLADSPPQSRPNLPSRPSQSSVLGGCIACTPVVGAENVSLTWDVVWIELSAFVNLDGKRNGLFAWPPL